MFYFPEFGTLLEFQGVVRKFNLRKFNDTWLNFLIINKFKLNF